MAIVGKPLVDIDTEIELNAEESVAEEDSMEDNLQASNTTNESSSTAPPDRSGDQGDIPDKPLSTIAGAPGASASQKPLTLATPAVRRLSKELDIPIETVRGSGPGGRIQKQDLIKGLERLTQSSKKPLNQTETRKPLTPIQSQMYKTMTRSLSLPQFLFSDSYDFTALSSLRRVLNEHLSQKSSPPVDKVSYFPLLVKAVSQTLVDYPILNARLDEEPSGSKPQIVYRSEHNIGVAIDSPSGLVVPVIRSVQNLSIFEISAEVQRFSKLAQSGSLSSSDLSGGTITVSNIGTIGGTTTTPMLVEGQLAILGIGKAKTVPGFDKHGRVVPRQETVLSWCADHRVIDGATLARMAGAVGKLIDEPGALLTDIR
ncbi:MAG: hypothetical protein M1814_002402 [Vezdaea aestivalis]|nr:MAG: hypothetical protein M1814_002402 [Vezdaea aestivalis]